MKPSAQSSMVCGSRYTPQVWPNQTSLVPGSSRDRVAMCLEGERSWQERCTRRSNLTVDAQWDKMSMARRNWRVVGESPHAPRWPLLSAKRAMFGVSPSCEARGRVASSGRVVGVSPQGKWPVMCQGVHDGVTPSGQEACGVSSGRGTCCAEGAWFGCPNRASSFVLDSTESQAGEDHCEGFMKVFFRLSCQSQGGHVFQYTKVVRARAWTSAS